MAEAMTADTRIESARQNGAQDAKIDILLTQATALFGKFDKLMEEGLPQCKVEAARISAIEEGLRGLTKTIQRVTLAVGIIASAVFGGEKIYKWVTGDPTVTKMSAIGNANNDPR